MGGLKPHALGYPSCLCVLRSAKALKNTKDFDTAVRAETNLQDDLPMRAVDLLVDWWLVSDNRGLNVFKLHNCTTRRAEGLKSGWH
jgi:hypothetical protein